MHFVTVCIILLLSVFFCFVTGDDLTNCMKACHIEYEPVCATITNNEGKSFECSFINECFLEEFMCVKDIKDLEKKPDACSEDPPECIDIVKDALVGTDDNEFVPIVTP
ncbi:hypothetical protein FF38_02041 [Lucilia cuprina]|uniref:Kazal-like domain-containing protein n=1 Tax=Lucilia cuprina TaxID=7375 RepID=A0A0L0BW85_LUCCU|nr:uncharacterized protein LOC111681310 [Lucilia cuprina]KAI8118334.1 hypothetical protein CVS40_9972 [Lucilia cuprina]KNC24287.1 hypothetical protein FF38_02041 [Lucilia cuprina]